MKKNEGVIYHHGYQRVALRLRLARYIAIFVFVFFTLFLFMLFREDMTLNHFRYLLRNFDYSSHSDASSGKTIYYDGEEGCTVGFVAGGFACLTDTRVFVTDPSSGVTFSEYHGYKAPRAVFSEKYMAVYDRAGSEVLVYNAFAQLESFTYNGTVLSCALADDGTLAVAVQEDTSHYSTVYIYNDSFEEVNKLSKYKYVTTLAFTEDGDYLALGSIYAGKNGVSDSELLLLKVGKKEASAVETLVGENLWQVSFFENEDFALLTDKALLIYDDEGTFLKKQPYGARAPHGSFWGKEGVLLLFADADSRKETLSVYSDKGELLVSLALNGRVSSMAEDENAYYLVTETSLLTLDKKTLTLTEEALLEKGGTLVVQKERVYYATASSAKPLAAGGVTK